jgi:hypothetical protein
MEMVRIRTHVGWLLAALGIAAVSIMTLALRATIWGNTVLLSWWTRYGDGHGYFRDMYRSEAVRQLGVAGIDPKRPYGLLGVECSMLKDWLLGSSNCLGSKEE